MLFGLVRHEISRAAGSRPGSRAREVSANLIRVAFWVATITHSDRAAFAVPQIIRTRQRILRVRDDGCLSEVPVGDRSARLSCPSAACRSD